MKYDYFIAGKWRNRRQVENVMNALRSEGKKVYCFIENPYDGDGIRFDTKPDADVEPMMSAIENLNDWQTNPTFKKIFENDMEAERTSEAIIVVFPAGFSAHMELGAAYGMGKKCYGIGKPEKAETLYLMFDDIFPTVGDFIEKQIKVAA
jgi:hypothetical protein